MFNIFCKFIFASFDSKDTKWKDFFSISNIQTKLRLKRNAIRLPKNWKYFTLLSAIQSLSVSLFLLPRHLSLVSWEGSFLWFLVFAHISFLWCLLHHCTVQFVLFRKIVFKLPSPFNFN